MDGNQQRALVPMVAREKVKLTAYQRRLIEVLAADWVVCIIAYPWHDAERPVFVGNGERLSRATLQSLRYRGLVELAGEVKKPVILHFFRLTARGWEAVHQYREQRGKTKLRAKY